MYLFFSLLIIVSFLFYCGCSSCRYINDTDVTQLQKTLEEQEGGSSIENSPTALEDWYLLGTLFGASKRSLSRVFLHSPRTYRNRRSHLLYYIYPEVAVFYICYDEDELSVYTILTRCSAMRIAPLTAPLCNTQLFTYEIRQKLYLWHR